MYFLIDSWIALVFGIAGAFDVNVQLFAGIHLGVTAASNIYLGIFAHQVKAMYIATTSDRHI